MNRRPSIVGVVILGEDATGILSKLDTHTLTHTRPFT